MNDDHVNNADSSCVWTEGMIELGCTEQIAGGEDGPIRDGGREQVQDGTAHRERPGLSDRTGRGYEYRTDVP